MMSPMGDTPNPDAGRAVADTGLLVAAIRAAESRREDRLFEDPFAEKLAGETGRRMLEEALATTGDKSTLQIVVRTKFWDEALLRATTHVDQVVLLAAGMDARAFRLAWPAGTVVYELDQPEVIAAKSGLLADASPRCRWTALGVDLTRDWTTALRSTTFDPARPAVWLAEGLLQYLDETAVHVVRSRRCDVGARFGAVVRRRRQDAAGCRDARRGARIDGPQRGAVALRHGCAR